MPLQSRLFHGDAKLEAAAVSDPSHIKTGAIGDHVAKIQFALIQIDAAAIADGEIKAHSYGTSTAAAVLAYKRRRNIVNRSYQTTADNIVGKMTIASLDREMVQREQEPAAPITITPLSACRFSPKPHPLLAFFLSPQGADRGDAVGDPPRILPGPDAVLELRRRGIGRFEVGNGKGGTISVLDASICKIQPDGGAPGVSFPIRKDTERFSVIAGTNLGRTSIVATASGQGASIFAAVRPFGGPPTFHPGVNHGHTPCRKWDVIIHRPNNSSSDDLAKVLNKISAGLAELADAPISLPHGPELMVTAARAALFVKTPLGSKHLEWYLKEKGKDFVEDDNIKEWIAKDSGIRHRLKRAIFLGKGKVATTGHFFFSQREYAKDTAGQDFRFAFGSIDRVDFEVDMADHLVRVWFQDRYEWHPFYPSLYKPQPGDVARDDNCLHAALVEMKDQGAADYWMKGVGEVPLSLIAAP